MILTDRNIYVFSGSELETIDQKHPVGMVEVRFDGRDLFVGTAKVRVYNGSHMDAAQLAEAAADDI